MNASNNQQYAPLELASKVEYALLALLELASHPDQRYPLTIAGITTKHAIPDRYLEQILTILRRGGIVTSQRGSKGGYILSRDPWNITLLEVIALMGGERKPKELASTSTLEREVIYEVWQQANTVSQSFLSNCTIQDLCQQRDARQQDYPMYYI